MQLVIESRSTLELMKKAIMSHMTELTCRRKTAFVCGKLDNLQEMDKEMDQTTELLEVVQEKLRQITDNNE